MNVRYDIQYHAMEQERKLVEDREENFRGTACVSLRRLVFKPEYSRGVDRKNIERLKRIFAKQGCLRLSPPNHVPAIIIEQDLNVALQHSGKTLKDLLHSAQDAPPKLTLPPKYMLECLHGQHRILAALEILTPKDEWWTVDLYLSTMGPEAQAALGEDYSNSLEFADGEIYGKIRDYQRRDKPFAERRWRAYLSKSKQTGLGQLLKRGRYKDAFDALLVVRGLWLGPGFSLGNMQELLAMRFDEEILHYLDHIFQMWSFILGGDMDLMSKTDRFTVEALQLRAPQASEDDFSYLKSLFDSGKVFPRIREEEKRRSIWNNIATVAYLIPSLYTLFEDLKLLSPCVKIVKALIDPPFKGSLHEMMKQQFSGTNQTPGEIVTQDTETMFSTRAGSVTDQFEFGYRQLYLFALRHFARMIGECAKKEKDRPKPMIEEPDPVTWHRFALLADRLGFDSEIIRKLITDDPFRAEVRNFVLKHNPPERYDVDPELFEKCVEHLARVRTEVVEKPRQYITPPSVVDGPGESLPRRCGRFFQTAYEYERNYLYLDVLYDGTNARGKGITSIFVRRSIYFAFFGKRLPNATDQAPRGRPPQTPEGIMTRSSPHNAVSGSAPTQGLADERSAQRGAPRDRPTPPPPSSRDRIALVATSQTSEMVCIHLSRIVHIRKLRLT
ncbi:hypothetical protein BKA61DRAFT_493502 [Leptodontidium sp. MPI-SDFR-AT-0119]|nr:hypothetical protein BKA61DRAFT_493502 [Leptodontidium sp. MPI-SDFR-AT-0119]